MPRCFKQQIVCCSLISPKQLAQFRRYREGDQVILHRQQFGSLALQPLLAFVMLAVGAAPMAAGVRQHDAVMAVTAFQQHHSTVLIAAPSDTIEGVVMAW
jgi:hypothetical protein